MRPVFAVACVLVALSAAGCTGAATARSPHGSSPTSATPPATIMPAQGPVSTALAAAGGCAGTLVTHALPPVWARAGFSNSSSDRWDVPWAFGGPPDTIAYLFATQLVAKGQRPDGSANKIRWVAKDGADFLIRGHPLGSATPVVTVRSPSGPSYVNVPTPGCWSFEVSWTELSGNRATKTSSFNLSVLPAGSAPTQVVKQRQRPGAERSPARAMEVVSLNSSRR